MVQYRKGPTDLRHDVFTWLTFRQNYNLSLIFTKVFCRLNLLQAHHLKCNLCCQSPHYECTPSTTATCYIYCRCSTSYWRKSICKATYVRQHQHFPLLHNWKKQIIMMIRSFLGRRVEIGFMSRTSWEKEEENVQLCHSALPLVSSVVWSTALLIS